MWQPTSPKGAADSSQPASGQGHARTLSMKQKNPGRWFAQTIKLKKECADEYKACHAKVWPEVLKQIKDCGIEDYSIFYDPDMDLLVGTFRYIGYDYAGDMQKMVENPKVREWWKMTDRMQESLVEGAVSSEAGEPSWWKPMEQVFFQP
ncbi:DUF718-domain-containing protein [Trichoderma longibrachiatum ATCC 18648]|uniref:DUF718-domain-containing protein n=1 Tax=Trichoderma longibrachiatum ATCC 18648 TaxID=983965 RepID=A0A2T4BWE4_TRILO|nr:DUF718-domain-containing protein [Trichoderma longibrachiatum ATCC 18648]